MQAGYIKWPSLENAITIWVNIPEAIQNHPGVLEVEHPPATHIQTQSPPLSLWALREHSLGYVRTRALGWLRSAGTVECG